ncbi:MAG: hypothetical protein NDI61_09265 [Bdellovibrionaceae bacterium]|nr:hypothetical protein [Pseudobdellovibrionaceae bacterium]
MIAHFMALHIYAQIAVVLGVSYVLGKAMAIPVIIVEVLADLARAKMPRRKG